MSSKRLELHEIFVSLLGSRNVYFQPPSSVQMKYPAIIYSRSRVRTRHADNRLYFGRTGYTVTVIDPEPDSHFIDRMLELPFCRFDRHFTANNLNHDVFDIYY